MNESELHELSAEQIKQLKTQIKNQVETVEAINNMTRLRILLLLWIYEEQSINDLREKLGKSWPTVTKHLEILEESGILNTREVKSRGPYSKKIYSVKPDLLKSTRLQLDFLKLPPKDVVEIISHDLKSDEETLDIIKKIFEDFPPYYEELERNLREISPTRQNLEEFYLKKHVNFYVELLDEEEFEFYFNKYLEFLKDLETFRTERKKKKKQKMTKKHYAVFDLILPLKEIQEARTKRLWKK
ncbi:MAG: ArsR family transcriptional regulator [Promethearchaeota archaeon]|nr:MAG: ArsR family transcriptional regulator [Candidatus Lokiarchaeota archaeon]